jgi:hypothetical protein
MATMTARQLVMHGMATLTRMTDKKTRRSFDMQQGLKKENILQKSQWKM